MPKCTYCEKNYESYLGTILVDSVSGKIRYFCSRKCRIYSKMHRKKRKWTKILTEAKTQK